MSYVEQIKHQLYAAHQHATEIRELLQAAEARLLATSNAIYNTLALSQHDDARRVAASVSACSEQVHTAVYTLAHSEQLLQERADHL